MSAVITAFESAMDDVRTAIAADDYLAARKHLTLARTYLSQLPDSKDADGREMKWRADLDQLEKSVDNLASATARSSANSPIKRHRITYEGIR